MALLRFLRPVDKDPADSPNDDDKRSNQTSPTSCKELHNEICHLVENKPEKKRGHAIVSLPYVLIDVVTPNSRIATVTCSFRHR